MLNHPEQIANVLHQNACGIGNVKQTTSAEALIVVFMMLGYTRIIRAAKPYRRSTPATGQTISVV